MERPVPLSRLIYFSENKVGPVAREAQIAKLMRVAVDRNRRRQITGALVYDDRWFAQALEGEPYALQETFELIEKDPRHANIQIISRVSVAGRLFGAWSMGFAARTRATEPLFGLHWYNTSMNPRIMSEDNILKLMVGLGQQGFLGL
jgi:hypothetical protein